jgi:hypothetical protein
MFTLPYPVWESIMMNLPVRGILGVLARVSQGLHEHTLEDVLWRQLIVRDNPTEEKVRLIAANYKGPKPMMALYMRRIALQRVCPTNKVAAGPTIIQFSFLCPLDWEDLAIIPGSDPKVKRRCDCCKHNVRLADYTADDPCSAVDADMRFVALEGVYGTMGEVQTIEKVQRRRLMVERVKK